MRQSSASRSPVSLQHGASSTNYVPVPQSPLPAPPGSVAEADGSRWRYRDAAPAKLTLLYFGYTRCPDVCPTTMADVSAGALRKLPAATRSRIVVQFVSTDPHRDTARQIASWLQGFDPSFHGGRAPIRSVITAAAAYGITIRPPKVSTDDYEVTHGAQLLVLRPGGDAVGYFRELAGKSEYVDRLAELVDRYA